MTHEATHTIPTEWRGRLDAFIAERMNTPFAWGVHDCCLFAADAVFVMTGDDPAAGLRGTYSDAASAARVLAANGGLEGVAGLGGARLPSALAACVGDVGIVPFDGRETLAVCNGPNWIAAAAEGLTALPFEAAAAAWRPAHA